MNFSKLSIIALVLILWSFFPALKTYCPSIIFHGDGVVAFADENDPYSYNEIKTSLASGNNLISFNRVSGLLHDLLREQKRLFVIKNGDVTNKLGSEIEDLINEASFYASENNYEESFKLMDNTHEIVMKAIRQLLEEQKNSK